MSAIEQPSESPSIAFDEVEQFIGCRVHVEKVLRTIPYGAPVPFSGEVVLKELRAEELNSKTFILADKENSFLKITPSSRVSFVSAKPINEQVIKLNRHRIDILVRLREKGFELEE